jgi:hypothetical protein
VHHAFGSAAVRRRVEIGVEDAAIAAKLQLESGALADLQGRNAETLDQLAAGQPDQVAALHRSGRDDRLHGGPRRRRASGGEEQKGKKQQASHLRMMATLSAGGKLAATATHR